MSTFADDETTVIWTTGVEIDETLKTAKTWLNGVLILVWPRLVFREVFAAFESQQQLSDGDGGGCMYVDM